MQHVATATAKEAWYPRLATFFACYPDPLALASDGAHVVHFGGELLGYSQLDEIVLHYDEDDRSVRLHPALAFDLFASIRFHRGQRQHSLITQNVQDLLHVVRRFAPQLGHPDFTREEAAPDEPFAAYTVVEMVTPLVVPHGDAWVPAPPGEVMGPNLTRCIDGLRQIVTAYRLTEHLPLPTPARERLGPMIVGATRPADPARGGWDSEGSLVINAYAVAGQRGMPPPASPTSKAKIANFLRQRSMDYPSTAIIELQADADTALNQAGDFRSAVMLLYTASEVMLDAVLMALCWEEGMTPAEAAAEFTAPLLTRVRTKYHDRIRGNWTTNANSPVERWRTRLVLLRHRVAHAGISLDRDQAEEALAAHREFREHLLNRLTASIGRYPRAAALLVTENGLRRRGAWTRKAREAVEALDFDTIQAFTAWRDSVLAARG